MKFTVTLKNGDVVRAKSKAVIDLYVRQIARDEAYAIEQEQRRERERIEELQRLCAEKSARDEAIRRAQQSWKEWKERQLEIEKLKPTISALFRRPRPVMSEAERLARRKYYALLASQRKADERERMGPLPRPINNFQRKSVGYPDLIFEIADLGGIIDCISEACGSELAAEVLNAVSDD